MEDAARDRVALDVTQQDGIAVAVDLSVDQLVAPARPDELGQGLRLDRDRERLRAVTVHDGGDASSAALDERSARRAPRSSLSRDADAVPTSRPWAPSCCWFSPCLSLKGSPRPLPATAR